ncbi:MAG: imidazole glycerol phosphate synthase subunit HisF [Candidatus Bathyarchaeota archaeon]|nr:imidazole glycerol phosphate synthase subunit HisF [Candidatus Bathyarchaeota archaeon]
MAFKRIIPCLDTRSGFLVKGVRFYDLKVIGDPAERARLYEEQGADEIALLDVSASLEGRGIILDMVRRVSSNISIPLIVGGGIRSIDQIEVLLESGADKVSINTAAVENPSLIEEATSLFGRRRIIVAIDAKRVSPGRWEVYIYGGNKSTGLDAVEWAARVEELGASEILLTSIDADGTREGYDIELTRIVSEAVGIPVIASGGAGKLEHIYRVLTDGMADAALAASIFHYGEYSVRDVKLYLASRGVSVRL